MTRSLLALFAVLAACSAETSGSPLADAGPDTAALNSRPTFAVACIAEPPCGGTISGSYELVGGCMNRGTECGESAGGKANGTLEVIPTDAGELMQWRVDFDYNGCPGSTSGFHHLGGLFTITGTTLSVQNQIGGGTTEYSFCANGDDLWVSNPKAAFPRLSIHHFKRK